MQSGFQVAHLKTFFGKLFSSFFFFFSMVRLVLELLPCHRTHSMEYMLAILPTVDILKRPNLAQWYFNYLYHTPVVQFILTHCLLQFFISECVTSCTLVTSQRGTDCLGVQWNRTRSGRVGKIWRSQINFFPPPGNSNWVMFRFVLGREHITSWGENCWSTILADQVN